MAQRTITLRDLDEERVLFGSLDRNLHLLRRLFKVDATSRGGQLRVSGEPDDVSDAHDAVQRALDRIRGGGAPDEDEIERLLRSALEGRERDEEGGEQRYRRLIEPRTEGQERYFSTIEENVITFGIGPAGTGKSFLAVAAAVSFLKAGRCRRIVLCRPAVEAGENLGFLPGDLSAKIDPYLRPLYDALHAVLPRGALQVYLEKEIIEILPLAYMRGRTLSRATIVLDEAQNCTTGQMKMALTRLGEGSRLIATGDVTQIDLPKERDSGLLQARQILQGIEGIGFCHLGKADIVRHPVVAEVVRAYTKAEEAKRQDHSQRRLLAEARPDSRVEDGADGGESRRRPPARKRS